MEDHEKSSRNVVILKAAAAALVGFYACALLFGGLITVTNGLQHVLAAMGQAGDFFGGLLNPGVAAFALFALLSSLKKQTEAVNLQKEGLVLQEREMKDTRKVLENQSTAAALTAYLDSLGRVTEQKMNEVAILTERVQNATSGMAPVQMVDGKSLTADEARLHIARVNDAISGSLKRQQAVAKVLFESVPDAIKASIRAEAPMGD